MEASVFDLRYKMKDVLEALERRESIRILYHGRLKGMLIPIMEKPKLKMTEHPFFGMKKGEMESVHEELEHLRWRRYNRCPM